MEHKKKNSIISDVSKSNKTVGSSLWLIRIEHLPIGAAAACTGAATLAKIYRSMGFEWVYHVVMFLCSLVLFGSIFKVVRYFATLKKEYSNAVTASLYGTIAMLAMSFGSYLDSFQIKLGKYVWICAVGIHIFHILIFTYCHVLKGIKIETFVPSWFATYNGFLVSAVTGTAMGFQDLCKGIVVYGLFVYAILLPFMIYRLVYKPIIGQLMHTKAVVLSPCSLCLTGYLLYFEHPYQWLVFLLYLAVLISLIYIVVQLPEFFSIPFYPGYAGLTFPMAIGVTAATEFSKYLDVRGMTDLSRIIRQIIGFQLFITTAIIGYVGLQMLILLMKKDTESVR